MIRARSAFSFKRLYSQQADKANGIQCDQIGLLKGCSSRKSFPDKLRRIKYFDQQTQKQLVFITNNMTLSAKTISELYRSRWQVELFFKWIKQHLRIKAFYGRTENAVKTQIWIAVSTYVLIAVVKKELNIDLNLYTILQILSVSLFEKISIYSAFSDSDCKILSFNNQLPLFSVTATSGQWCPLSPFFKGGSQGKPRSKTAGNNASVLYILKLFKIKVNVGNGSNKKQLGSIAVAGHALKTPGHHFNRHFGIQSL